MDAEGVSYWYCTPSQVVRVCLMSTAQPHGYCTYFIQSIANALVSEKIGIVIKNQCLKKGQYDDQI